jgi:hypothetical protein
MNGHISNRNLAAYLADAMDASTRERIGGHIAGCDRCRALHDKMFSAISPRYASLIPGGAVRDRVLLTRDELERGERKPAPDSGGPLRVLRPRLLGVAALGLAASIAIALAFHLVPPSDTRPTLVAELADAGVTINGRPATRGARVYESSALVLPDKTTARFAYGRVFSITLIGPCVMTIDRLAPRGSSGSIVLEGALEQGVLVSIADGSGAVSYAYTTPGARVEPVGTEFLLQASGESTLVVMKSGKVRVRPARSAEAAVVAAGSRCMVDRQARVSPASAEDMRMIDSREGLGAGAFVRRLLPVHPLKRRGPAERLLKYETIKKSFPIQSRLPESPVKRSADRFRGETGRDHPVETIKDRDGRQLREKDRIEKRREAVKEVRKARRERARPRRAVR